ncbi:MAG: hypothetical protein QM729_01160 [Solirubrobacterales bacterium]
MAHETKGGTKYDPAALERTEARFWREAWDAVPAGSPPRTVCGGPGSGRSRRPCSPTCRRRAR